MNILFTSSTPFHPLRGGVGRVTDTLCKALKLRKHNVWYLHQSWYAEDRQNYDYPAPTTILPYPKDEVQKNHQFYINFLQDHQIDVVICQDALYDLTFHHVDNIPVKVISVIHNNPLYDYNTLWHRLISLRNNTFIEYLKRIARSCLYYKIKHQMWRQILIHFTQLYRLSDKVLLLSPHYIPAIESLDKEFLKKTDYIYNPNTYPVQNNLPSHKNKELLYVGRLYNSKRIDRLLKVWSILWKEFPDWNLTIVGDGTEKENLLNLSRKLRLGNINFTGFQDPLPYYQKASIMCMTSNFEGFPMTLVEAMQFGCVPIAFDSFEAIHDTIIPEKTGEIVTSFDLNEYREKLANLMRSKDYRDQLSINAFEHVKQFDISSIVTQWEQILNNILIG